METAGTAEGIPVEVLTMLLSIPMGPGPSSRTLSSAAGVVSTSCEGIASVGTDRGHKSHLLSGVVGIRAANLKL